MIVGFGDYRAELEATAPDRALFTGPLEHRHLAALIPLADVTVVPSIFPEAFGMVAAEAAAAGSLAARREPFGPRRDRRRRSAEYPERLRELTSFATGDVAELAEKLRALLALSPAGARGARRAPREHGRRSSVGAGPASRTGCWSPLT